MIVVPPPSQEVVQAVYSSLGVDEKRVKESVIMLKEWLELQPHLPHVMDEKRLENIFLRSKASVERAKSVIDMYYTLRNAVPEFFSNRDPTKPWFKSTTDSMYHFMLPKLTEEHHRVILFGVLNKEAKFDAMEAARVSFMCHEVTLSEDCSAGQILILDMKNATLPIVSQFTPAVLQKCKLCVLKGFKCRVKAFHILNCPSYGLSLFNLLKTMLKPKLAARVHIHLPGYETLHNHVSPKILPQELGGEAESLSEMWDAWKKKLHSYRDWYLKEDSYKADESRRPGKAITCGDLFGIEGSFRKLAVD